MARPKTHQERRLIISWIVEMVKKHGHAMTKDIVDMFGIDRSTAEKYIRLAIKQGELIRHGAAAFSATSAQLSTLTWNVSRTGEQHMSNSLNNKSLVAVGHQVAKAFSTDTPIIEIAKIVSHLAKLWCSGCGEWQSGEFHYGQTLVSIRLLASNPCHRSLPS